ncbi:MAG: ABC transporter ATP-binding protein [Nitrospiraceae bacterium]|nr:ABC transporter ATP-binding protein [Nitrospiraceae bacterium]
MPSIEVNDLWVRYGDREAVRGVSLAVEPGRILCVLGRNGAGKTSTIEAIEGYRRIAKGTVRVLGLDPARQRREVVKKIGVMLQVGGIYPRMNPRQALDLYAGFYDDPVPVDELVKLAELGSAQKTPYRFLSGGEKQRLALALALVGRPDVLFLDEPTAGVDAAGKQQIRTAVADMARAGVAVLLTTHELNEAERLADSIAVIDEGRIIAEGTPTELRERFGKQTVVFRTASAIDVASFSQRLGLKVTDLGDNSYRLGEEAPPSIVGSITALLAEQRIDLVEMNAGRGSLEDVFLEITNGEA